MLYEIIHDYYAQFSRNIYFRLNKRRYYSFVDLYSIPTNPSLLSA